MNAIDFTYPPIKYYQQVADLPQDHFKMTLEEYFILFDMVKQAEPRTMLEFGAGDGISAAVMLLAAPEATMVSIDVNPESITRQCVPQEVQKRLESGVGTTDEFRKVYGERTYDLALIDADHQHEPAAADINWGVEHCKVLVAHDIIHPGVRHINRICKDAAERTSKHYVSIEIGHGLGVIF